MFCGTIEEEMVQLRGVVCKPYPAPAPCRSGCRGEAPCPPEAAGAERNSYNSKIEDFAV